MSASITPNRDNARARAELSGSSRLIEPRSRYNDQKARDERTRQGN